jgi:hypothetical protein
MGHFRKVSQLYTYLTFSTLLSFPISSLARKTEIHDKKILEDLMIVKSDDFNNQKKASPSAPQKYPPDFFPKELDNWKSFYAEEYASEVIINLPSDFYKKHKNMEGPPCLVIYNERTQTHELLYPRKISNDGLSFRYDNPKSPIKIKAFFWEDETAPLFKKLKKTGSSPSQTIFEAQ